MSLYILSYLLNSCIGICVRVWEGGGVGAGGVVDWIHLVDVPLFFYKGVNFCDFLFAFLHTNPLLKRGLF